MQRQALRPWLSAVLPGSSSRRRSKASSVPPIDPRRFREPLCPLEPGDLPTCRFSCLRHATNSRKWAPRRSNSRADDFRADFAVGVPSDFYAGSYGEATILLDAAYSAEVLPGSHIDVYVNGNIAATVPITTRGGEILRHLPINVTLRHFRPGTNIIAIEAVLLTQADAACVPGAVSTGNRFALFDTSEFVMPRFARIGQRPNLAAIAGTGFPYGRLGIPIPLVVDHSQPEALSAAATFLARMATVASRLIPVDVSVSAETVGNRDALFVGPVSQQSSVLLTALGISEASRTEWGGVAGDTETLPDTEATFDEWRDRLAGRGWRGQVSALEDWLDRNFEITSETLRVTPSEDSIFMPSADMTLLVAQSAGLGGEGTWTLVTAPTPLKFYEGMRALSEQANSCFNWPGALRPTLRRRMRWRAYRSATSVSFRPNLHPWSTIA